MPIRDWKEFDDMYIHFDTIPACVSRDKKSYPIEAGIDCSLLLTSGNV